MSLQTTLDTGVLRKTAAVACAVFPRGHAYLRLLRDALGPIYADIQFAELFACIGEPAACPWRLALIALLQISENLSDRCAVDAVRARIEWKYLLGLDLAAHCFVTSVPVSSARASWLAAPRPCCSTLCSRRPRRLEAKHRPRGRS